MEALTLTPPQYTQALLSGDIETDSASFYDRVWAAIRDKYRSEVCGERRESGVAPTPTKTPPVLAHPVSPSLEISLFPKPSTLIFILLGLPGPAH